MQLLVFVLVYPALWLISILPYRIFYFLSDIFYFIVYRVIGYRKKIVYDNLKLVFPQKSEQEIKRIRNRFFSHLCDLFMEMIKTMNLNKTEINQRYVFTNPEVVREIEKTKTVLVVCSHYANWEWNVSLNNHINSKGYAVYQKVNNKYFDKWTKSLREQWGTTLITQRQTVKKVLQDKANGIIGVWGMVSDQSPQVGRAQYWSDFMGINVPIFNGAETMARKMDLAVVFLKVSKVKRGFYEAEFITITTSGSSTKEHEITEKFLRLTEQQIIEKPEYYLWTHRRWKHRNRTPKSFATVAEPS